MRISRSLAATLDAPQPRSLRRHRAARKAKGAAKEAAVLAVIVAVAFLVGIALLATTHSRSALACCSSPSTSSR